MSEQIPLNVRREKVNYAAGEMPESYTPARWVGTLPASDDGRFGLTLSAGLGEPLRLSLDAESARHVAETLAEMLADYDRRRSHSDTSEGMPSAEGSTPAGLKV